MCVQLSMIVIACLAACVLARVVDNQAGFVHVPVREQLDPNRPTLHHALSRRADKYFESSIENTPTFYAISLELGTPPQSVTLAVDTSQGDTLVLGPDTLKCTNTTLGGYSCANNSVFNPNKSSTFKANDTGFEDDTEYWAEDKATFGNLTIDDFNFAYPYQQSYTHSFFGLGPYSVEFDDIYENGTYTNVLNQLKSAGYIDHPVYSLWLNAQSTKEGSVLFGAIDKAKFFGDLYRVPLVPTSAFDKFEGSSIPFEGLSVINGEGVEQRYIESHELIYIESDTRLSVLPNYMIEEVYELLGAELYASPEDNDIGWIYDMECSKLLDTNVTLGIELGGLEVRIPFRELGYPNRRFKGVDYCVPGFLGSSDDLVLGANILRKLYVVFDLENEEIGLATAKTGEDLGEDIEVLSTGIPGKKAPEYASKTFDFIGEELSTKITVLGPNTYRIANHISDDYDHKTSEIASTSFSIILGGTEATADNRLRTTISPLNSTQATVTRPKSSEVTSGSSFDSSFSDSASVGSTRAEAGSARATGSVGRTTAASTAKTSGPSTTKSPSSSQAATSAPSVSSSSSARASSGQGDLNRSSWKFLWASFFLSIIVSAM